MTVTIIVIVETGSVCVRFHKLLSRLGQIRRSFRHNIRSMLQARAAEPPLRPLPDRDRDRYDRYDRYYPRPAGGR